MDFEEFDLLVIGAGISGISAARFYLEVHPNCRLAILEKDVAVGGVWNSRRIYDSFWTQWVVGSAEFSDEPMARPPEKDTYYDFFKAKYTMQYLENYIDNRGYAGKTLRDRIRFGFEVRKITKVDENWVIEGEHGTNGRLKLRTSKLIVASGLTSKPNIPDLPGRERFKGQVLHQEKFGQSSILPSTEIKHITVIGGAKSAADMVYESIKAGKTVSWVIRASGTGPAFFVSPKGKGPYKNAYAIGSTRLAGTLSPSFLNPDTLWTRFLHGTTTGRNLVSKIWGSVDGEVRDLDGKSAVKGLDKLIPHSPIFWQNGTGGLVNRPDFWDTIAGNVEIYADDILEVDKGAVKLKGGAEIPTDAILCGTGWTPSLDFFDKDLLTHLGLPHSLEHQPSEEAKKWAELENEADQKVLKHFPSLGSPPEYYRKANPNTPYRLYNGIAPLKDDSIAFIGHVLIGNYFRAAECQAIWATGYLDKKLSLPSLADREAEVALFVAWCRRRYLSNGEYGHWLPLEMAGYTDMLLKEVGLSSHLKGWFSNYFKPGIARDLAGLKAEYVAKYGRDTVGMVA